MLLSVATVCAGDEIRFEVDDAIGKSKVEKKQDTMRQKCLTKCAKKFITQTSIFIRAVSSENFVLHPKYVASRQPYNLHSRGVYFVENKSDPSSLSCFISYSKMFTYRFTNKMVALKLHCHRQSWSF